MPILLTPDAPMERPGVGVVISSAEALTNPARGVAAFLGRARKGPLNRAIRCTNVPSITRVFGGGPFGGDSGNTMDGAMQALLGRATAVWVVRMGSGGAAAGLDLAEGAGTGGNGSARAGAAALRIEAAGPGTDGNNLSVAISGAATDPWRMLIVTENGVERERLRWRPGTAEDELDNLLTAFGRYGSDLISLSRLPTATGGAFLAEIPPTPLEGGEDVDILIDDIQAGLEALGSAPFETIASDLVEDSEVDLFVESLDTWIEAGKLVMGTVAAHPDAGWSEKLRAAPYLNNPAITYVGNGFVSNRMFQGQSSPVVIGYEAAAREAGRLTALPLARQLTHAVLPDGVQTVDEPPPDVIAQANAAGVYLYSTNARGQVWTEWGITTQKDFDRPPVWASATDSGWSKQRLVLTRFRLLTDIELAWMPLIETATNNDAGRESIRTEAQNVIDLQYVPTGAVERGVVRLHPDYPPAGERATFLVELLTPDGLEFLVLEARFRR